MSMDSTKELLIAVFGVIPGAEIIRGILASSSKHDVFAHKPCSPRW
jgi:hypothetical protein